MNILIATIGNKDLQISNSNLEKMKTKYAEIFITNTESSTENVISKENKNSSFVIRSKFLYDAYQDIATYLSTPIIDDAISSIDNDIHKIILVPTNQYPKYHTDTLYAALIIEKLLSNKYDVEVKGIDFNPNNIEELQMFFSHLFSRFSDGDNLYIENAGGTPTTRTSTFLAGLFKNYKYLTLVGKGFVNNSFRHIEMTVLKNMLDGMLRHYDYEGIKNLPGISQEIKDLSDYAISRLNLDVNNADYLKDKIVSNNKDIYILKAYSLLRDIITSARIKYEQAAYPDFIWRLFTFHDNYLIKDVENILGGEVIFNNKNNHQIWNELISKKITIRKSLEEVEVNKSKLDFSYPNKYAFYHIVKESDHPKIEMIDIIHLSLHEISTLRNKIAHHLGGLNIKMISEKLSRNVLGGITRRDDKIEKLFEYIYSFLDLPKNDKEIFDQLNQQIRNSFETMS